MDRSGKERIWLWFEYPRKDQVLLVRTSGVNDVRPTVIKQEDARFRIEEALSEGWHWVQ